MTWQHWATVIGLPAIGAFATAFAQSGDALTRAALSNDGKVALGVLLATIVALVQRSPLSPKVQP